MKLAHTIAVVLLAFLGITAVAGALPMILHPRGSEILPLTLLQHSPFHSFLVPGLVLLTANGLLALWVLRLVVSGKGRYGLWTLAQGCILLGWLVVECLLLRAVVWLHYLYGAVALVLILSGTILRRPLRYG